MSGLICFGLGPCIIYISAGVESVYIHDRGEAFHLQKLTQLDRYSLGGEEGLEGDITVDLDKDS